MPTGCSRAAAAPCTVAPSIVKAGGCVSSLACILVGESHVISSLATPGDGTRPSTQNEHKTGTEHPCLVLHTQPLSAARRKHTAASVPPIIRAPLARAKAHSCTPPPAPDHHSPARAASRTTAAAEAHPPKQHPPQHRVQRVPAPPRPPQDCRQLAQPRPSRAQTHRGQPTLPRRRAVAAVARRAPRGADHVGRRATASHHLARSITRRRPGWPSRPGGGAPTGR